MDAKVTWSHGLSFSGQGFSSGFELPLGAEAQVGGENDGFRPMELILIGLAGCTAMDVISILQKKRQDVTAFEVKVHAERAENHPRVFTHITIEYILTGHGLDPAAAERAAELSETKYCPAQAMLGKAVPIERRITILEA
ncbi:MAG: OsmC family protein [Longilinea sp.]|nr:OsmC family protein [Longilinea sp.]MCA1954004.1 OsmC family protein [Anaerolinea sp.]